MSAIKSGSQGARILQALANGRWTSVSEIHRLAGVTTSFNATVTRLRKAGWTIEHRVVEGKPRQTLANQYRLRKPWPAEMPPPEAPKKRGLDRDSVPRDKEHRLRIYITDKNNELILLGAAKNDADFGRKLLALCRNGEIFEEECLGVLDTFGLPKDQHPGIWLLNPWGPKTI